MKVLVVLGTRPEAVKLAPVVRELRRRAPDSGIETVVCSTAQHREMLDQVLTLFGVRPDYDLDVMARDQTPTQVASAVLARMDDVLRAERPDWVVVQGDTTTVAAASLAAFYARVRVAHVEAGLRTFDKWQPFPEEVNRRVAGVIADLHFAPTETARANLIAERVPAAHVLVTGNTVIDAVQQVAAMPNADAVPDYLRGCGGSGARLILVTAHRRENLGRPLEDVCAALRTIALRYGESVRILYPVHLNPNVRGPVARLLGGLPNVVLTEPLDYLTLVRALKAAYLVLTDSGGLQEEAPSLGVPVLVLRNVTERPEAVQAGAVRLVGTDAARIVNGTARLLDDPAAHAAMTHAVNPYGDGAAAERIVASLLGEPFRAFVPDAVAV